MKDHREFEMLSDEIPHAASINLHHLIQQKQYDRHHHNRYNHHPRGYVYVNGERGLDSESSRKCHGGSDMHEDDPSSHYKYMCASPVSGFSLKSESSTLSSHSGGFSLLDEGSPTPPPLEETKSSQIPPRNAFYLGGFPLESQGPNYSLGNNAIGNLRDDLNLSRGLHRLCITEEREGSSVFVPSPVDSNGIQVVDCLGRTNYVKVEKNGPNECYGKANSGYGTTQCLFPVGNLSLDDVNRSALLCLQRESQVANLSGSCVYPGQFNSLASNLGHYTGKTDLAEQPMKFQQISGETLSKSKPQADAAFHRNCNGKGVRVSNSIPFTTSPPISDASYCSQRIVIDSNEGTVWDSLSSPLLSTPSSRLPVGTKSFECHSLPVANGSVGANSNIWIPQLVPPNRNIRGLETCSCEDSLIIQEKDSSYMLKKKCDLAKQQIRHVCNESENSQIPKSYCPFLLPLKYNSLSEVQGYIYFIATDQHGCRFLQRKIDEGAPQDVQMIFNEIINHVVELMMNPFGNYLIQKLLDVCTEEQRMEILLMVTSEVGQLVEISLNSYGTRAVQKLIETLKTRQQISLLVAALESGFLKLIKDLNGNHVVQRCLERLSNEDNKFIFNAAARYCVDIGTHRHGCCVLQRCIAHSTGERRRNLITEISANGLLLSQDAFGNYVIQYILDLKIPFAAEKLISQFQGNYVHLSVQKFSSNVVEKCIKVFGEEDRSKIINELLSASQFELLLQDPYANYVIQSALKYSKGPLHAALVEAIRPHAALRTSPYCKKIFSRPLLRK